MIYEIRFLRTNPSLVTANINNNKEKEKDLLIEMGLDKESLWFFYDMENIYETAKNKSDVNILSGSYFNDRFRTY